MPPEVVTAQKQADNIIDTGMKIDAMSSSLTDKFDSFSLGVSILSFIDPELISESTGFSSKKNSQEAMDSYFDTLSNKISASDLSEVDKKMNLKALDIAKGLLKVNPDERASCATAAIRLNALVKT